MCFCTMHSSKNIVVNIGYLHYHSQKWKAFVEIHEIYPVNIVSFITSFFSVTIKLFNHLIYFINANLKSLFPFWSNIPNIWLTLILCSFFYSLHIRKGREYCFNIFLPYIQRSTFGYLWNIAEELKIFPILVFLNWIGHCVPKRIDLVCVRRWTKKFSVHWNFRKIMIGS